MCDKISSELLSIGNGVGVLEVIVFKFFGEVALLVHGQEGQFVNFFLIHVNNLNLVKLLSPKFFQNLVVFQGLDKKNIYVFH